MSVNITINGANPPVAVPVQYAPNAVTTTVESKLIKAYGAGLLMQGLFGVTADNLVAGDYQFAVTAPLGMCHPLSLALFHIFVYSTYSWIYFYLYLVLLDIFLFVLVLLGIFLFVLVLLDIF